MSPGDPYQATDEPLARLVLARMTHAWRPLGGPYSYKHEWEPDLPTRFGDVCAVPETTRRGLDSDLLTRVWRHFTAANERFGFPIGGLEWLDVRRLRAPRGVLPMHRDTGQTPGTDDRLLSMSLMLTAPDRYDGGDLELHPPAGPPARLKAPFGGVVVFPSDWPHRVNRVTAGERLIFTARAVTADAQAVGPVVLMVDGRPVGSRSPRVLTPSERGRCESEGRAFVRASQQRQSEEALDDAHR